MRRFCTAAQNWLLEKEKIGRYEFEALLPNNFTSNA